MKQTNLPHPIKTQKLDKYVYKEQRFCDYNITFTIFVVSAIRYPCEPEHLVEHLQPCDEWFSGRVPLILKGTNHVQDS